VGDWKTLGTILADSAKRLESGGATVMAICANTMHKNFEDVANAVSIPVVDVRDAPETEINGRVIDVAVGHEVRDAR
jgi:aspartate racemase